MVLGRQEGADVALQHEVRAGGSLDCLADLRVGGVDQIANLMADGLLPLGQGIDVGVDAWVQGRVQEAGSLSMAHIGGEDPAWMTPTSLNPWRA